MRRLGIALAILVLAGCSTEPTVTESSEPPGPAIEDGRITLDYPRIVVYHPMGQPVEDVARFGAVMAWWLSDDYIDQLRIANPRLILFDATSACELTFDPDWEWGTQKVHWMPPEWFLTQVGSVLTEGIDDTTTTIRVEATTIEDGGDSIELFVEGDALLVDGESMYLSAVDHSSGTLTVERGYVRPASAHPAGTRVAAHVMTWPYSWVMNLSTMAPEASADGSDIIESYAEYNAGYVLSNLDGTSYDGLFIDRSDPGPSRLLWSPTVRTLDPDQSNTFHRDLSAFDRTWGDGIRDFEGLLRDTLGEDFLIYVNWGMANYDLLNGQHHEAFPMDDGRTYGWTSWGEAMFGPEGYFEWMNLAQEPRFSVIQTYLDDGAPGANIGGAGLEELQQDSACVQEGFEPEYRKARFGLTTTLMNDGFFSFESSTFAQSWLCLFWFDEYDAAGLGTGYLGQPLGDAFLAHESILASGGHVWRRDFEGGIALVNATDSPVTIPLGEPFRKIAGTQDPSINDGSVVEEVTIGSLDGIILLRLEG